MNSDEKRAKADEIMFMMLKAKAQAYSNLSLKRPLTVTEFKAYKEVIDDLQKLIERRRDADEERSEGEYS